jgi:hypothetical protein
MQFFDNRHGSRTAGTIPERQALFQKGRAPFQEGRQYFRKAGTIPGRQGTIPGRQAIFQEGRHYSRKAEHHSRKAGRFQEGRHDSRKAGQRSWKAGHVSRKAGKTGTTASKLWVERAVGGLRGTVAKWQTAIREKVPEAANMPLQSDVSPIFEELNVAWAAHELYADGLDDAFDFFEASPVGDHPKMLAAVKP